MQVSVGLILLLASGWILHWTWPASGYTCPQDGPTFGLACLLSCPAIFFNFAPSVFDTVQATTPPPSPFTACAPATANSVAVSHLLLKTLGCRYEISDCLESIARAVLGLAQNTSEVLACPSRQDNSTLFCWTRQLSHGLPYRTSPEEYYRKVLSGLP